MDQSIPFFHCHEHPTILTIKFNKFAVDVLVVVVVVISIYFLFCFFKVPQNNCFTLTYAIISNRLEAAQKKFEIVCSKNIILIANKSSLIIHKTLIVDAAISVDSNSFKQFFSSFSSQKFYFQVFYSCFVFSTNIHYIFFLGWLRSTFPLLILGKNHYCLPICWIIIPLQ